jgi:hypothetical protein
MKSEMKIKGLKILICLLISSISYGLYSCKEQEVFGEDPYAGGKEALGVTFVGDYASPESGAPGSQVTFGVKGLKNWENKFKFYLNEQETEVLNYTDSTITVVVPELVSTGGASIRLEGQVFFGPRFEVEGKVKIDNNYKIVNGTNYQISDALEINNHLILVGGFTNFENKATTDKPINSIVAINNEGELSTSYEFGRGANGNISSIVKLSNNQMIVAGGLYGFNNHSGVMGITRLNNDGKLDTTIIEVINLEPEKEHMGFDTIPSFNGGVYGGITKVFAQEDPINGDKIVAIGNFRQYGQYYLERATRDYKPIDITNSPNIIRMDMNGKIDSSYAINPATGGFFNFANGGISDGYMHANHKLVMVGSFTNIQGASANRIVRMNEFGLIDPTFNAGTGANDAISNIEYDPHTDTYMIVGQFTQYNGVAVSGIARLKGDGSLDQTFNFRSLEGGVPTYAKQLSSGKIIVTGTFQKYDNVLRRGMLILESDGEAKQDYNSYGGFSGTVFNVVESTSSNGHPALIMMGYIQKFNDQNVYNILKVEIAN